MVDALSRAHDWVTPPLGCVIDLRPAVLAPNIEIALPDGSVHILGVLVSDDDRRARHRGADAAIASVLADGLFVVQQPLRFPYFYNASSPSELRAFVAENWQHLVLDDDTYARVVGATRDNPGAQLRLHEQLGIQTLRPQ